MLKLILLFVFCTVALVNAGYGPYAFSYGYHAGGHHGGYGGHGHGGHATVNHQQNPHSYKFGVQEHGHNNRHHWQTASTGHGGYGHGHGYY